MIFRLKIAYFIMLRMHHFFPKFPGGAGSPYSTSVNPHRYRAAYNVRYSMAKPYLFMCERNILSEHVLYVNLIVRRAKYILGRIGFYFWGFGEKLNFRDL